MKIDAYTKVVLTMIALCLLWMCVRDTGLSATVHAQSPAPVQEVVIVGVKGELQLPVAIKSSPGLVPVAIQQISVASPYDPSKGKVGSLPIHGAVSTGPR